MLGIIDELYPRLRPKWLTAEAVTAIAEDCNGDRKKFRKEHSGAYAFAKRTGLFDTLFPPKPKPEKVSKLTRWTRELIIEAAAPFKSRKEFKAGHPNAYNAAYKRGMMAELFGPSRRDVTNEELFEIMGKYRNKAEFRKNDIANYSMCLDRGILHEALPVAKKVAWSIEEIESLASQCSKRSQLQKLNPSAYNAARRMGILAELIPEDRVPPGALKWTEEAVIAEASKYTRKQDFMLGSPGAHVAANRYKMLSSLFPENDEKYGLRDSVYLWKAGDSLYKVGITSSNIEDKRIKDVARYAKVGFELLTIANLGSFKSAYRVESALKKIGSKHDFGRKFNGSSEFRVFNDNELATAFKIINEASNDARRSH
jgi:hypothetical protein